MRLALDEALKAKAEGNVPAGSIIVLGDQVVSRGHNLVPTTLDVTAHAEVVAIRKASIELRTTDLNGCTLYTTMEPCPLCCGAIIVSRISALVLGGRTLEERRRYGSYSVERLVELTGWDARLRLVTGVMQESGEELLREWIRRVGVHGNDPPPLIPTTDMTQSG
jgi:tRNA(adenine34) deaminase